MQTPLISVIVPVYNVEPYLRRCVDSILRQTYRNLEILLVDDGSTDRSGTICDACAQQDTRVKVIHRKNGGLSAARNCGLETARGEYISFVDSDDLINDRMIETLYRDLAGQGADISAVGYRMFENQEELRPEEITAPVQCMTGKEAVRRILVSEEIGDFAWNKLYKKILFQTIRYPEGRVFEDLGTTYRLLDQCDKVTFRPDKLYCYFQRPDSILHRKSLKFYRDKYEMVMERDHLLRERYPEWVENDAALLNMIQNCYPYLYPEANYRAEMDRALNGLNPEALKLVCPSTQRKYRLLKFNRKLYAKLFLLKNGQAAR